MMSTGSEMAETAAVAMLGMTAWPYPNPEATRITTALAGRQAAPAVLATKTN